MDFEVRESEEKGRLGGARVEEELGAIGHEIGAVAVGEVDGFTLAIEEIAFVGVRGPLEFVGRFPEIEEAAAVLRLDGSASFGRVSRAGGGREMPLADVVGGVPGLFHHAP
jgi:hypothetical protein